MTTASSPRLWHVIKSGKHRRLWWAPTGVTTRDFQQLWNDGSQRGAFKMCSRRSLPHLREGGAATQPLLLTGEAALNLRKMSGLSESKALVLWMKRRRRGKKTQDLAWKALIMLFYCEQLILWRNERRGPLKEGWETPCIPSQCLLKGKMLRNDCTARENSKQSSKAVCSMLHLHRRKWEKGSGVVAIQRKWWNIRWVSNGAHSELNSRYVLYIFCFVFF